MVIIRAAMEKDYEELEQIMKQVHRLHTDWRPDIYKSVDTVLPYEMFLDHLSRHEILVAESQGLVRGLMIYVTRLISGGPMVERKVLYIDSMAVDETCRGQGIGHKLFDYVKEIVSEGNYDGLELQVNAKNTAAMEMYRKYGFREKSVNMEIGGSYDRGFGTSD